MGLALVAQAPKVHHKHWVPLVILPLPAHLQMQTSL